MMNRRALTLIVLATLAALPASAWAQTQGQPEQETLLPGRTLRPYRGIFGGGTGNQSSGLILTGSFGAGHDQLLTKIDTSQPGAPVPPPPTTDFGSGQASLTYIVDRSTVGGEIGVSANGRYYPGLNVPIVGTYQLRGDLSVAVGSRTILSTSNHFGVFLQSVSMFQSPVFSSNEQVVPLDFGGFTDTNTYQSGGTSVRVRHDLNRRLAVNGGYRYYVNNAWASVGNGNYAAQGFDGSLTIRLTNGLGLRLGYDYSTAGYTLPGAPVPFVGHSYDVGLNFQRAISLTRRTRLSFSGGASSMTDRNLRTVYFATGHATLWREIGRTGNVSLTFDRTADFFQTLGQPVVVDRLALNLGAMVGRRMEINGGMSVRRGTFGIVASPDRYTAASASVGVQIALIRELALGVRYSRFQYEFNHTVVLPPGVPPRTDRQNLLVTLNAWVPLMNRQSRRANAAR